MPYRDIPVRQMCAGVEADELDPTLEAIACPGVAVNAYRCDSCQVEHDRRQAIIRGGQPHPRTARSSYAWRRAARQVVDRHLEHYGPVCPGHDGKPHEVLPHELTVDHVLPLAHGGTNHPSNLQVLCRTCNGRRGAIQ